MGEGQKASKGRGHRAGWLYRQHSHLGGLGHSHPFDRMVVVVEIGGEDRTEGQIQMMISSPKHFSPSFSAMISLSCDMAVAPNRRDLVPPSGVGQTGQVVW